MPESGVGEPNGTTVLDFPDPNGTSVAALHVNHGLFWADAADLGTTFFWDAYVAPRTPGYLVSDGYGGAHAMLWGPVLSDNQMIFQGNIWNGQGSVDYAAIEGPSPGEWGHHAIGMVKDMYSDNVYIYTYWNGITVGINKFGSLTRHSATVAMGNGVLYVMGSHHQNLSGRLAALRVWDRSSPLALAPNPGAAFVPERVFSSQFGLASPADFLADYTRPAIEIADLSPIGYGGGGAGPVQRHPGRIVNGVGAPIDSTFTTTRPNAPGPLATWIVDDRCPYGASGQLPPNPGEAIPEPSPVPAGALVFDSFGRRAQNFVWQQIPTLGKTEGGSLGPLDWMTGVVGVPTVPAAWGIINGRAVFLENQMGVAWVNVATPDQDISVKRFSGATATGIAFRIQDVRNYWFVIVTPQTDPLLPSPVLLGYFQGGVIHSLGTYSVAENTWVILRVQAVGSTITVYRDKVPVGSLTNALQFQAATGAGLIGAINPPTASSFWRADEFTVCGAAGC